jgi:peptide-methionine (S)-S-oxide reductase
VGTQYRSAIYFHNEGQREIAKAAKLKAQDDWDSPIVTEIKAFETFYEAEDYHQAYYELHKEAPYCQAVIAPKLTKFKAKFSGKYDLR